MNDAAESRTANEALAGVIADALIAGGFVPPGRAGALRQGLVGGSIKEPDWRMLIECALPRTVEANDDKAY